MPGEVEGIKMRPAGRKPRHPSQSNLKERKMDWRKVVKKLRRRAEIYGRVGDSFSGLPAPKDITASRVLNVIADALEAGLEEE